MQFAGKKIALLSALFFWTLVAQAQLRYGIRAGLNFATLRGPYEQNSAGEDLERFENVTGFHIGIGFAYPFTDEFGLRSEFMYSKKGLRYTYEGDMYRIFTHAGGSTLTLGEGRRLININQSYIDIPITAYYRLKDFELSAGVYAALQVQAVGEGSAAYSGKTQPLQNPTGDLRFNLQHNYRRDKPGEGKGEETISAQVDARTLTLPMTLGAYYDYPEDRGRLYNSLDYGLTAGASYFLSRALYIGARIQYGLADLTRDQADLQYYRPDADNAPVYRADFDRNFNIQLSLGFSF